MSRPEVSIWDPNGVNPYSGELASIMLLHGYRVSLWVPRLQVGTVTIEGCIGVRVLASNRSQDGVVQHALRRFLAPLLFIAVAVIKRKIVVLCWVRGWFEALLFASAAPFLKRCVLIDHNPIEGRNSGTSSAFFARLLRKSADKRVVHSRALTQQATSNAVFIPHLRYAAWAAQSKVTDGEVIHNDLAAGRLRVLLLGALRPDKGWADMHVLFNCVDPAQIAFSIVGTGALPDRCTDVIKSRGIEVETHLSDQPIDDQVFARAIMQSELLVAPYVNATASGTVMLAFSCDLPTLAFRSGALDDILNGEAMVDVDDYAGLARLIQLWSTTRFPTYKVTPQQLDDEVVSRWGGAVAD